MTVRPGPDELAMAGQVRGERAGRVIVAVDDHRASGTGAARVPSTGWRRSGRG